jgi:ABC-type nitrate/sulfonate/bicarbonate transport system substrate-binding protein
VRDPQNSTQVALAERLGYFKEAGVDVAVNWVTSFSDLYAPAGAGQIDFTVTSVNNGLKWHQDNIPMRYLAILTNIAGGQGVAVNPAKVKTPKDFESIKIGMATGSTVELAIRNFAKANQLDFGKFQFVNLQPPDQLAALSSDQVQAIAVWEPWLQRAVTEFGAKRYFTGRKSFIPGAEGDVAWLTLPSGLLANTKLLKERPQVATGVLSALLKAEQFVNDQPKKASAAAASLLKMPAPLMETLLPTSSYSAKLDQAVLDDINTIEDFLIASKKLKAKIEPTALFDLSFLKTVAPTLVAVSTSP